MRGFGKTKNEKKYPHIVELAVASDGLNVKLNQQIVQFHRSRHCHDTDVQWLCDLDSFIAGASTIYWSHMPSSSSSAESSAKQSFETQTKDCFRHLASRPTWRRCRSC
jgi:hypothetical protein